MSQADANERLVARVVEELADFYTPEETGLWLRSPHPLLDGRTAADLIAEGKTEEVLRVIALLRDGAYGCVRMTMDMFEWDGIRREGITVSTLTEDSARECVKRVYPEYYRDDWAVVLTEVRWISKREPRCGVYFVGPRELAPASTVSDKHCEMLQQHVLSLVCPYCEGDHNSEDCRDEEANRRYGKKRAARRRP